MTRFILFALAITLSLTSSNAEANDRKTYGGLTCISDGGFDNEDIWYASGRAFNGSDLMSARLSCGGLRDTGSYGLNHWAYVTDRHYSQDVQCRLLNRDPSTGSMSYSADSSSGSSSSPQRLSFARLNFAATSYTFLQCEVPARYNGRASSVDAFNVDER